MDDWAKVYSTLTDQQLLALIREPETLRHEARVALEAEIRMRGLEPGAEAPPLPKEQLSDPNGRAPKAPLDVLTKLNVIVLVLSIIFGYFVFMDSLSETLPGHNPPYGVERGFTKAGTRSLLIAIGAILVPGTFLLARAAALLSFRVVSATYNGLAALTLACVIVTTNVTAMHPIAFAVGDLLCYSMLALLAAVNGIWLIFNFPSQLKGSDSL
jgi:hypothetical protein